MEISVGHVVQDIQRHFEYYNPKKTLDYLSLNQKEGKEFQRWYRQMYQADNGVFFKLKELYPILLMRGHSIDLVDSIISLLENEYREAVENLNKLGFPQPKSWFDSWSLLWMLKQINTGTLMDDEEYADHFGLPFTDTDRRELRDLKDCYCADSLLED